MSIRAPWPINKYGTTWRHATMVFHWADEPVVTEAIETIDPLNITVRLKPVAIGGAYGNGRLSLRQLVAVFDSGEADYIIIHPCCHPALFNYQPGGIDGGDGWFHVVGIAWLDLANAATYEALQAALEDRREQLNPDVPYIEF